MLFYYAGDGNWWLGDIAAGQLTWSLHGNTYGDELRFTDAEREQVVAEVQEGLTALASLGSTANLS